MFLPVMQLLLNTVGDSFLSALKATWFAIEETQVLLLLEPETILFSINHPSHQFGFKWVWAISQIKITQNADLGLWMKTNPMQIDGHLFWKRRHKHVMNSSGTITALNRLILAWTYIFWNVPLGKISITTLYSHISLIANVFSCLLSLHVLFIWNLYYWVCFGNKIVLKWNLP